MIFYIVAEVVKPEDVPAGGSGDGGSGAAAGAGAAGLKKQSKLPKCATASALADAIRDPSLKGARTRVRCVFTSVRRRLRLLCR
jgi:hypothetical protein